MKIATVLLSVIFVSLIGTAYAQVNGTDTNSTSTVVEEIVNATETVPEPIPEPQVAETVAGVSFSQSPFQGTTMLGKIHGDGFSQNVNIILDITDPFGDELYSLDATTTNKGEFDLPFNFLKGNPVGQYRYTVDAPLANFDCTFEYDGSYPLKSGACDVTVIEVVDVPPETQTTSTPSTSSGSSSSSSSSSGGFTPTTPTTTNADLRGILELLRTIIETNNAILIQIESMLANM